MRPEAVIFDVDGTLLDSVNQHAQAWVEAFAHFGVRVPFEQVRPHIGKGGDQIMPAFLDPPTLARLGQQLERYRKDVFQRNYLPHVQPFPQVPELFLKIRDRAQRIALATSGKADEVETYMRIARIEGLVDAVTSADDVSHSKPAPDIFHAAVAKLAPLPAERILAIGDTAYDAQAAAQAGLSVIGLLCGGTPEEVLQQAGCTHIYQSPADLLARYDESPLAGR